MCYRGGPRCETHVKDAIALIEIELQGIEARRQELAQQEKSIKDGQLVPTGKGGNRTLSGVQNDRQRLFRTRKLTQERLKKAQADWQLTTEGIQELRDAGEDVKAMKRQAERDALLEQNRNRNNASRQLERVMLEDGFDPRVIDYCNVQSGGSKNIRTAASYMKSRELAIQNLRRIEQEKAEALANAKTDAQKKTLTAKYDERIERQVKKRFEAEHDYFVTPEGLAELQAEADNPDLSFTQQVQAQIRHDRYAGMRNERVNDANLRQKRYDRITGAYRKAGKDPKRALNAHLITSEHNRKYVPEILLRNKTVEICLNEEQQKRAYEIYEKSGYKGSFNQYAEEKILSSPVQNFRDVALSTLNAGVKETPKGHHRQRTQADGDTRELRLSFKWGTHNKRRLKSSAVAFHTTASSYALRQLLDLDVRQHSNDRSVIVNEERTQKVTKMMKSGKIPA